MEARRNVEIKAFVPDPPALHAAVQALTKRNQPDLELEQSDVFYSGTREGSLLKLRNENGAAGGSLIGYRRPHKTGPKLSKFHKVDVPDWKALHATLRIGLGRSLVVTKQRRVWIHEQTRIHLDRVTDLGDFVELEVMLRPGQSVADGQSIADVLMDQLGIDKEHLCDRAYKEMLEERNQ